MLEQYLETLERIPDDIVLSAMTRDLELFDGRSCLCGWVLREQLAKAAGVDAEEIYVDSWDNTIPAQCAEQFGGTVREWDDIYQGVTFGDTLPIIEHAVMLRVLMAVQ